MRKYILASVALLTVLVTLGCNKTDTPSDPQNTQSVMEFYPGGVGSKFVYSVDTLNTTTNQYENIGTRESSFTAKNTLSGKEIYDQKNVINSSDSTTESSVKFWRSAQGVYFLVDTSGFGELLTEIPDSVKNILSFEIDENMIVLSSPLQNGRSWNAFKMLLKVTLYNLSISVIEVTAASKGTEEINIPAIGGTKTAEKIEYTVKVSIPDLSNILNPPTTTYKSTVWYVKDIGAVKFEGSAFLINAIGTGEVDLDDSAKEMRQVITSYDLK